MFNSGLIQLLKFVGGKNVGDEEILFEAILFELFTEIVLDGVVVVEEQPLNEWPIFRGVQFGVLEVFVERINDNLFLEILENGQP